MGKRIHVKWGFGMAPVKPGMNLKRNAWVKCLSRLIDEGRIEENSLESISEVKGMFNRIVKEDQWDWFTVFVDLGYPSRTSCRKIVSLLADIRKAVKNGQEDELIRLLKILKKRGIKRHLNSFLRGDDREKGKDKIYILSTRENPQILKIGFTKRSIVERVNEINSVTGVLIPYSARALWAVKDGRQAEKEIHDALSEYRVRSDREFFEMDFPHAVEKINQILQRRTGEILISPVDLDPITLADQSGKNL